MEPPWLLREEWRAQQAERAEEIANSFVALAELVAPMGR